MKLRRLLFIFLSLLLLPLALVLLVLALLQLDPVRVQLLTWGQRALQGQGINIQLEGWQGHLPLSFGLDHLTLADEQGVWLELEGLRLAWKPMALLQGRVHVEELSLRRFALERLPPTQGKVEPPPVKESAKGPIELRLPEGLPLIQVDRLALSSIALGAPVLGEAIQLGLDGEVTAGSKEGARARLALRRLDQDTAKVILAAGLDPNQTLELNLEAEESGGLVKRLAKLPLTGPLSLQLHGRGAITDWPGELKLSLPGMLELVSSLRLALGETPDFGLEGTLTPAAGLIEPKIAALIGQKIPFALGARLAGEQHPVLRKLQLETALAKLDGRAEADLDTGRVALDLGLGIGDLAKLRPLVGRPLAGSARLRLQGEGDLKSPKLNLKLEAEGLNADKLSLAELAAQAEADLGANRLGLEAGLKVADLARLEPLIGQPLSGSAQLKLLGAGELLSPKLDLILDGHGLKAGQLRLAELATQVKSQFLGPLDQGFPGVGMAIQGRIKGLETGAEVPADSLTWKGELRVPATGPIEIPRFEVAGGNIGLDLSGRLNPQNQDGSLDLRADIADLAPWAGLAGAKVSGGVSLNAQAEIGQGASSGGARLEIRTRKLNGLPPAVGGLLGPELVLIANAKLKDKRLHLDNLSFKGKEVDLTAQGAVPLAEGPLALRTQVSLPRLEVLDKGAGIPIAGGLVANLDLEGTLQAPRARLELQGQRLKYDGRDLQQLQARVNADQLTKDPKGELDIRLGPQSQALGLSTAFAQQGAALTISNLRLSAPATQLQGQFKLDTKTALVQGELRGRAADLGALNFWSGRKDLKGALDLVVALAAPKTQEVKLQLKGSALGGDFGHLDEVKADLALADAQALAGLDLRLLAKGIAQGDNRLESVTVTAKGDLQRLDLSTKVVALQPKNTKVDLDAQLQQVGQDKRLLLQRLTGAWQGKPFQLKAPVELTAGANKELRLGRLGLDFAGASLSAEGRLGARDLNAELVLDPLPLKLLAELGLAEIEGTAKAKVNLGGTKTQPQVRLDLDVQGLKGLTAEAKKLPPARVTAKAELISGQLAADLGIAGLTDKPARLQVAVPMRLALEPFDFRLDERSPLQGSFEADADIGRLSRFLSLDEQKLAGALQAAVRLGGRIGNPELGGSIRLQRGLYENGLSGTLIKDLDLEILLSGQSARITRLSANDGGVGRIEAKGGLTLDSASGGFQLNTEVNLDQATLVRSDDASATLSGQLAVAGDQRGAQAKGNLSIDKAEIRIPERVGPDVPKLEVKEIRGRAKAKGGQEPDKASKAPAYPVNLDIKVDIPSRTFVRGRGLDSEWRGNLEIAGQAQEPRITGQLRVQRGLFDFLDRRFKIQEGSIDFYGGSPPIPNINLKADAAGRDMLAILSVQGSVLNPKLTLESQPTLPQDEVLARLLFDRSVKDISALQALKLAAAVKTLAGGGRSLDFLGKARDSLGLDTLDMGGAGSENKSVKAGKYLREDVYLEVESGLGSGASKVRVEKEISRQLSVETSVDQDSSSAFGINWKVDY